MHEDLTIPFLLRTTVSKKLPIFINAGPFIGFLLKETTHSEMMTDEKFSSTNTSAYKNFDIRITVGLGLLKPFGNHFQVSLEIRDNFGLYDINNNKEVSSNSMQANSLNFLLGFSFKLAKRSS